MPPLSWIKLYIEIVDDHKMGTLPDRLWRRSIELFLLAGRENKEGRLPPTAQIAWSLRMSTDELERDLQELSTTDIIQQTDTGWIVTNFLARQAPSTEAQRKAQQRDRERHGQYDGDVTKRDIQSSQSVTQNRTEQIRTEQNHLSRSEQVEMPTMTLDELEPFHEMQVMCEKIVGRLATPGDMDTIRGFVQEGITEDDLRQALVWFDGQGKTIYSISQFQNSVRLQKRKRIQAEQASTTRRTKPGASNPPIKRNDPAVTAAMREQLKKARNDENNLAP